MKAREMIIDFASFLFLLLIIIFSLTYFIVGDRLAIFGSILKALVPFSYIGLFFIIKLRQTSKLIIYSGEKDINLYEVILIFTKSDYLKNIFFISLSTFSILIISLFNHTVGLATYSQAFLNFLTLFIGHLFLFRKKENSTSEMNATLLDKIVQETLIFLLPLFTYLPSFSRLGGHFIDMLQSLTAFAIMYLWYKLLFKKAEY